MAADLLPTPDVALARSQAKGVDVRLSRKLADLRLESAGEPAGAASDGPERVAQLATARLEGSPVFRGRGKWVQFTCQDDCLFLDGCLPSYYLKQLAQETVRGVPGVAKVVNRIVVSNPFSLSP